MFLQASTSNSSITNTNASLQFSTPSSIFSSLAASKPAFFSSFPNELAPSPLTLSPSSSPPPQQSTIKTATTTSSTSSSQFPTSILENLLQNSDLLETLLKPIADKNGEFVDFDEKLLLYTSDEKKIQELEAENNSKIYGNAFLGPNLWNQNEKYSFKFEYLDVQEFLAENGLEASDADILTDLQNAESNRTNGNKSLSSKFSSIIPSPSSTSNTLIISPPPAEPANTTITNEVNNMNNDSFSSFDLNKLALSPNMDFECFDASSPVSVTNSHTTQDTNQNKRPLSPSSDSMNSDMDEKTMDRHRSIDLMNDDSTLLSDDQLFGKMASMSSSSRESRKHKKQFVPNELKDDKYWARRRKNNMAAKRSRDARRLKENQVALRAAFLERENASLRRQLDDFKRETKVLKTKLSRYEQKKE